MNQIKKLAGDTFIYGFGTIVPRFLNYAFLTPFYTRIFDEAGYGIYNKLYAYIAFTLVLLTFGTETSFFRFSKKYNDTAVFTNTFTVLLFTIIIAFFSIGLNVEFVTRVLNINGANLAVWMGLGIVTTDVFMSLPFARLRYQNRPKHFSVLKLVNVFLIISLNIFFYKILPHYSNLPVFKHIFVPDFTFQYALLSNLISNSVTLLLLIPVFRFQFWAISFRIIKKIFLYSYPILLGGLAGMINDVGDKIILDFVIDNNQEANYAIGIYSANYKIAMLMMIFIQMFKFAVEPFFFKISDQTDHKRTYSLVTKAFSYTGLLIFLGIIGYIDIIKYFVDEKFHSGLNVVPIVLLGNFFFGIYYNVSIWFKITDKTHFSVYFTFLGSVITLLLLAVLVPVIGIMGAAVATLICFATMALSNIFAGNKYYKIPYDWKNISKLLFIALILGGFHWFLRGESLFYSLIFGTLIIFVYLFSLYKIDQSFIKYIIKK